jgi:hypothetical protein
VSLRVLEISIHEGLHFYGWLVVICRSQFLGWDWAVQQHILCFLLKDEVEFLSCEVVGLYCLMMDLKDSYILVPPERWSEGSCPHRLWWIRIGPVWFAAHETSQRNGQFYRPSTSRKFWGPPQAAQPQSGPTQKHYP